MADQPPPGQGGETPKPGATGTAPTGPSGTAGVPDEPKPSPGTPPSNPAFLGGHVPGSGARYEVDTCLLPPAAARADDATDKLRALGTGLALGMPSGMAGFQTGWQAGTLADGWSFELGRVADAARACADKIRFTLQGYLEAEARNTANMP
jgi:hypothetical protein